MSRPQTTGSTMPSWCDLLPDLLGRVIAKLPFPADRARFRAVCRAWHSAARHHTRQLPWIVFPDGSFCTIGGGASFFFPRIPSLPDNVTCLGAAGDGWLALDHTDDVLRRRRHLSWAELRGNRRPRPDVKHRHAYLLHNPFSGETVPLPELDSIVGDVAETFEIRKVLMRSASPDDLVAVTTSNWNCNIILCRPGKGSCVVPYLRVFDVAFHGDRLYGITPEEELVALDLAEDDRGKPSVTKYRRVIRQPLADGEQDRWSWMYDDYSDSSDELPSSDDEDDDEGGHDGSEEEAAAAAAEEESSDDNEDSSSFNGDGQVPDGVEIVEDMEVPYEPKDYIRTTRRLVQSSHGDERDDLLMVRHHLQTPSVSREYTRGVEIFKADMEAGRWVPVNALAQGEALFLSRSLSKSTRAHRDIKEGFIYFADIDDVFDTKCWGRRSLCRPRQWRLAAVDEELLTWLFPPQRLMV